jgi:transcriptional regulator with XRE-family HTH domain
VTSIDRAIGKLIRKAREHLKLPIEDTAEELGIPVETLISFETGALRPAPHQLLSICAVLRVQPSWFFPELLDDEEKVEAVPLPSSNTTSPEASTSRVSSADQIEISFPGNIRIVVGKEFNETTLRRVVAVLRNV